MSQDLRTKSIVLRRTNYGESDRIITFLTPAGRFSALARGVRKEKSRLAGGIELFCLSDIVLHQGRGDLAVLTSAKMLKFYQNLLSDLARLQLASDILKRIARATEYVDSPDFFTLADQAFSGLNQGLDLSLVESWFLLNLARISGSPPNLSSSTSGQPLLPTATYVWDSTDLALRAHPAGPISAAHIKLLRLMVVSPLSVVSRVSGLNALLSEVLYVARSVAQI